MNRRSLLLLLASSAPLAGCMQPSLRVDVFEAQPKAPYTLATGDRLRIIVFGQDNLSNIYAVDGAGRIAMPLAGTIPVAGLTTQRAAEVIEGKLRQGFIRDPKVTVEIETYRPFFILGEVTTSGQFPFVSGMTVQNAVAIAGGFTPRAARTYAEVTRRVRTGIVVANVPMTFQVQPGDTIVVKERWF